MLPIKILGKNFFLQIFTIKIQDLQLKLVKTSFKKRNKWKYLNLLPFAYSSHIRHECIFWHLLRKREHCLLTTYIVIILHHFTWKCFFKTWESRLLAIVVPSKGLEKALATVEKQIVLSIFSKFIILKFICDIYWDWGLLYYEKIW